MVGPSKLKTMFHPPDGQRNYIRHSNVDPESNKLRSTIARKGHVKSNNAARVDRATPQARVDLSVRSFAQEYLKGHDPTDTSLTTTASPERLVLAERMSHPNVTRHLLDTCLEKLPPKLLRSCRKVARASVELAKLRPTSTDFGGFEQHVGRLGPTLADSDRVLLIWGRNTPNIGPNRAMLVENWAALARCGIWPQTAKLGRICWADV